KAGIEKSNCDALAGVIRISIKPRGRRHHRETVGSVMMIVECGFVHVCYPYRHLGAEAVKSLLILTFEIRIAGHSVSLSWLTCCSMSDRKSTRLNSSHDQISYAVFCLKKKKKK